MSGHGGKRPGAGRPKGALNRDGADIRAMVIGALDKVGGLDYLAARAIDSPSAFLTLVGKVLPLQLHGDPDHPVQFVIRGPSPVESANDWLKLHAPVAQIVEVERE
jgi:hypothetical protein